MLPEDRIRAAAPALKVFPLPQVVLLPGLAMPLHIFEPRYRALVEDCLAQDQVMGLWGLRPGWEQDYGGRPPMEEVGCAGLVVWSEALPDGAYNILLQGVARVRLLAELPADKLYREVRVELCQDPPYHGPLEELVRQAVLEVAGRLTGGVADSLLQLAARARGGALADAVAAALVQEVEVKQEILQELDPQRRLERVLDAAGELIARMGAVAPRGPLN